VNYFQFYDIPENFLPDEQQIKQKYYELSRKYHPDFHAQEDQERQQEILHLSTLNTDAYRTLSNPDSRMQYILEHHGLLEEGRNNELPGEFLMEMMELNEQIMELDFDFDQETFEKVSQETIGFTAALEADILPVLHQYPQLEGITKLEALKQVKTYYLKKKYLLRIQQSLSKFATQSH
jgi:molecular chaperone HscB